MTTDRLSNRASGDDLLLQQAADWLARLDTGAADPAEFARWREADPRHALAFVRVAATAEAVAAARVDDAPPVHRRRRTISRRSAFAALALGTLALGGGVVATGRVYARERVRSPVGGTRHVRLPDGSAVWLNTDSVVSWRNDRGGVKLWLEQGEIALTLRNRGRAFQLIGGEGEAVLLPGHYNARLKGQALDLMVLGGGVEGSPGAAAALSAGPRSLLLTRDQQLTREASADDMAAVLAWRDGEIVFVDEPLATAVDEYNRYLMRKILIVDPALRGIRVGGRFTTKDSSTFLAAVHATLDIDVVVTDDNILLTRKIS